MPAPMPPAPEVENEQAEEKEDPIQLVQEVGQGLQKIGNLLKSDKDKAQMSDLMGSFMDLVERNLGGADAQPSPQQADSGSVPMEGGLGGVPAGPNQRM